MSTVASTRPHRPHVSRTRLYLDEYLDDLSRELHLLARAIDAMMTADDSSPEDLPALAWQVLRCQELVSDLHEPAREDLSPP
jgi:hypothetical protein